MTTFATTTTTVAAASSASTTAAPAGSQSTSFRQAYGVLRKHAEALRSQSEPNIDDLLTIVTESVQAYKVCQERIDAVEKALARALGDSSGGGGGGVKDAQPTQDKPSPGVTPTGPLTSNGPVAGGFDDMDDIPF